MRMLCKFNVRRPKPEGHFTRLLMGILGVMWGAQSLHVGQDDVTSAYIYRILFQILTLDQLALIAVIGGVLTLCSAAKCDRNCDFIIALLMSAFWSCIGYFIREADYNALSPVLYGTGAVGNAMTVWIILVRHPSYEQ